MKTQTPRNDCFTALFHIGMTKDFRVQLKNCVALNDFLYDFMKDTILDAFEKRLTDEMKKKLLEVLMRENADSMEPPPRKRPLRKVAKPTTTATKKPRAAKKRIYPAVAGYRSVYFPQEGQ